jgi:hypothetical protein
MNRKPDEEEPAFPRLEQLLSDFDELLRLRLRTTRQPAGLPKTYAGFSMFVDAFLPSDAGAESRIARALRLDDEALRLLRRREIDLAELPADALATLGRCASLDWITFDTLVASDLTWFAEESPLAMLRDNTSDPVEVRRALRAAWERDALDEPGALGTE